MKQEKITTKSNLVYWRMLELTENHKSFLVQHKVKLKNIYSKNNVYWVLQKHNANMDDGVYINWPGVVPTDVVPLIASHGFVQFKK